MICDLKDFTSFHTLRYAVEIVAMGLMNEIGESNNRNYEE